MPLRGLLVKHFTIVYRPLPCFQDYQKAMLSIVSFSKTALVIRKNVIEKSRHLSKHTFLKNFDNVGRILTGLKFSFISFLPLLYTGVTSVDFKEEGKLEDLIALFMLVHKKSTNISIFSLIVLVGISVNIVNIVRCV